MKKLIGILVLLALCLEFSSMSKGVRVKPFIVLACTSQKVHAGIKGGMNATYYNVRVLITNPNTLSFDSLRLAEGLCLPVRVEKTLNDWNKPLAVNDTVLIVCTVNDNDWANFSRHPNPANTAATNSTATNLLLYSYQNKKMTYSISDFKKLPPLNMP